MYCKRCKTNRKGFDLKLYSLDRVVSMCKKCGSFIKELNNEDKIRYMKQISSAEDCRYQKDSPKKIYVDVMIEFNNSDKLNRADIKKHIKTAILFWGEIFEEDHPLFTGNIKRVGVGSVKTSLRKRKK
jgi:hypothetical protein